MPSMRKLQRALMLSLVCTMLAGCSINNSLEPLCGSQTIDWVNALKVNDILYVAPYGPPDPQLESQQGEQVGEVDDRHVVGY